VCRQARQAVPCTACVCVRPRAYDQACAHTSPVCRTCTYSRCASNLPSVAIYRC
jgi:hypothetical protein